MNEDRDSFWNEAIPDSVLDLPALDSASIEGLVSNAGSTGKVASIDDDSDKLRIETWKRPNADGTKSQYWQWAKRGSNAGKKGGKRWRSYGGQVIGGEYAETTGKRGGRRNRAKQLN